jgi:hypothetical protein
LVVKSCSTVRKQFALKTGYQILPGILLLSLGNSIQGQVSNPLGNWQIVAIPSVPISAADNRLTATVS